MYKINYEVEKAEKQLPFDQRNEIEDKTLMIARLGDYPSRIAEHPLILFMRSMMSRQPISSEGMKSLILAAYLVSLLVDRIPMNRGTRFRYSWYSPPKRFSSHGSSLNGVITYIRINRLPVSRAN